MGGDFDEPAVLDLDYLPHVLLGGEDELVVDDPARQVLEQARVGVYVHRLLMLGRLVGAGLAQLARVVEEAGGDRLADGDRVVDARDELDLDAFEQVEQLIADVAGPLHRPMLNEVLVAPLNGEVGLLPLAVHVEEREMVARRIEEVLSRRIRVYDLVLGPIEDGVVDGEHGRNAEYLLGAFVPLRGEYHLGEHRIDGKLGHAAAELGQLGLVVERAEGVQLLESDDERLVRRRIHVVEVNEVVDAQALEQQHHVAQIGALYLGYRVVVELLLVRVECVQAEAFARCDATRSTGSLIGRRLRYGRDDERLHAGACVVGLLLAEARIDDVHDAVDGERRLGDVGGEDDFARVRRSGLEYLDLHVRGQIRVDGQHDELVDLAAESAHTLADHLGGRLDLLLTGQEDEYVARRLTDLNLKHGDHHRLQIVSLGLLRVVDVDREAATLF